MSYLYVDSILGYIDDGIDLFIETMRNGDQLDQNALNARFKTCQNYVLIDFYEFATRDKVESRLSAVKEMGIQCRSIRAKLFQGRRFLLQKLGTC